VNQATEQGRVQKRTRNTIAERDAAQRKSESELKDRKETEKKQESQRIAAIRKRAGAAGGGLSGGGDGPNSLAAAGRTGSRTVLGA
jgi:hypothetical protein